MPSEGSIFQRHQGFDVPGRAYDIDPNAVREFQGSGAHEAFRSRVHEKKGHDPLQISKGASWTQDPLVRFAGDSLASEEPMPSPREGSLGLPTAQLFRLVLAMTLLMSCSIRLLLHDGQTAIPLS